MNLSAHFTLDEFLRSDTAEERGIDNSASVAILENLRELALRMEDVRSLLNKERLVRFPDSQKDWGIKISSGYRCPILNTAVGGSPTSAHMIGLAADFSCPNFGPPLEISRAVVRSVIAFDQCIEEGGWVHISFDPRMRRLVRTAHFGPNGTTYTRGLT